jgi:hypothetical protein
MLMKRMRNGYRELSRRLVPVKPLTTIEQRLPAANANNYTNSVAQARRLRRQRRSARLSPGRAGGWTVSTW